MKGIVSFSLFGDNPIYSMGALRNVEIWQDSEFDVDCRFYVGKSVPGYVRHALELDGAEVIPVDHPEDQTATFWRYDGLSANYEYYLFRDTDSRPFDREFYAIREWLKSSRDFHIIRDHPWHGVPILAGLWGVKAGWHNVIRENLPNLPPEDFYKVINRAANCDYTSNDFYQVDQWWLRLNVYRYLRNKILAHDEFFGFERKLFKARLPERVDNMFCGEGFDQDDHPRFPEHRDMFDSWPRRSLPR